MWRLLDKSEVLDMGDKSVLNLSTEPNNSRNYSTYFLQDPFSAFHVDLINGLMEEEYATNDGIFVTLGDCLIFSHLHKLVKKVAIVC